MALQPKNLHRGFWAYYVVFRGMAKLARRGSCVVVSRSWRRAFAGYENPEVINTLTHQGLPFWLMKGGFKVSLFRYCGMILNQ